MDAGPRWKYAHGPSVHSEPLDSDPTRPADEPALDELVKIGAAAAALGVSLDTLRRWERTGKVSFVRRDGRRYMPAANLAGLLRERNVMGLTSARNRLQGIVIGVKRDSVMAQVDMVCGPYRIVSLMSREACDELGLKPGDRATAVVKATTVIVEKRRTTSQGN